MRALGSVDRGRQRLINIIPDEVREVMLARADQPPSTAARSDRRRRSSTRLSPSECTDGRLRVPFKAAWRSGAAHAEVSADKFLARLCALVPPPGFHMTRYFGDFANRHHLRSRIIESCSPPAARSRRHIRAIGGQILFLRQMVVHSEATEIRPSVCTK